MENKKRKLKTIDLVYVGLCAALITICSWLAIPLTVPITLQTLAVCVVAGIFGAKKGTLSLLVYILLGSIGVPVFSGFKGGIGVLFGATGGYIIGFIFTTVIVGVVSDKTDKLWIIALSMLGGVLICYAFGTAWFAYIYARDNSPQSLATILSWCVFPFILPDIIKIAIAAVLTKKLKKYVKK
jgi:biotin transport system substrate-specific component